jgi:hypothetical protein
MATFDPKAFAIELLAESVFHDEDYGVFSNLILIDPAQQREAFYAYHDAERDDFVIEEANAWEKIPDEDVQIASGGKEHSRYDSEDELAEAIYHLAETQNLQPRVMMVVEDDEDEDED